MYNLPYFKEKDESVVLDFIAQHPFAFIAGCDANGMPVATQIPVFLEQEGDKRFLRGHIMRHTDHHKAMIYNPNVLVVFTGPHVYVSATWYSNPVQASTWNYMSVHAKGQIRFLDEAALISILRKTSLHFEGHNENSTTYYENLPASYTQPLLKAIVPFEIEITQLENVFKLSQNRDPESYDNIIHQLRAQGGDGAIIAKEMENRKQQIFPPGKKWENPEKY